MKQHLSAVDPLRYITFSTYDSKIETGEKLNLTDESIKQAGNIIFDTENPNKEEVKYIIDACNTCSLEKLFEYVHSYFEIRYPENKKSIRFLLEYRRCMDISCLNNNDPFIYLDELIHSVLIGSLSTIFFWSEYNKDETEANHSFGYLLYIIIEQCRNGFLPNPESIKIWGNHVKKDMHILNLSVDAYHVIITFALAHEFAHIYLNHQACYDNKNQTQKQELEADKVAYECVLAFINAQTNKSGSPIWDRFYEHVYLAPLMFFDYYDLIEYTKYVLEKNKLDLLDDTLLSNRKVEQCVSPYFRNYKQNLNNKCTIDSDIYPSTSDRKKQLLNIVDLPEYELNTEEGNIMYNCFLDICDEYKQKLISLDRKELLNIVSYWV